MTRVDCTGMVCPMPIIELARGIESIEPGEQLELWSDDPAAATDVAAWCRMQGHELVSSTSRTEDASVTVYVVRRSAAAA